MDLKKFKTLYKAECRRLFSNMGFRINGNNCWRVTNNIYQAFYLHNSVDGEHFTVEFASLPLCDSLGIHPKTDPRGLWGSFIYFSDRPLAWLTRDASVLTHYFKYLIPFFENSSTLEGIVLESIRLHNRLEELYPHLKTLNLAPPISLFVYLKLGMLDKAISMVKDTNPRYIEECGLDMDRLISRDTVWLAEYLAGNERRNRIALGLPPDG